MPDSSTISFVSCFSFASKGLESQRSTANWSHLKLYATFLAKIQLPVPCHREFEGREPRNSKKCQVAPAARVCSKV